MSKVVSFEKPDISIVSSMEETKALEESDIPFRILLLGDWSGQCNDLLGTPRGLSKRRPIPIDRDNFEDIMKALGVGVSLSLDSAGGLTTTLRFNEIDDFLPDNLLDQCELFQGLRQIREELRNPATLADARDHMRAWTNNKAIDKPTETLPNEIASASRPVVRDGANLLDQILGASETESPSAPQSTELDDLKAMLHDIVKPHLVRGEDPQQANLLASIDEATSIIMRAILHDPQFQAIESAWRALYFLLSRLETGSELKLYILDIPKSELSADLSATENVTGSDLYKLLVKESGATLDSEEWAVLAGNYTFDQTIEDIELLSRLGQVAMGAIAPFLAGGSAHILGCESLAVSPDPNDWKANSDGPANMAWSALRHKPVACFLGLALPRFLLRLPYGKDTDPTERFEFEEIIGMPRHEDYLWGNPSFICTYLLAEAFGRGGWNMHPVAEDVDGLPLHVYKGNGATEAKPCAEVFLSIRAAERILKAGPMPLLSFKEGDSIRLGSFQSLSDPATSLSGKWN